MSGKDLRQIGSEELTEIIGQLNDNLSVLERPDVPDKVRRAVQRTLQKAQALSALGELATPYAQVSEIANTLNFLRLVASQRAQAPTEQLNFLEKLILKMFPRLSNSQPSQAINRDYLEQIDQLIQSCYKPVADVVARERLEIEPDEILAVYFEGEYLARPREPVPFLLVPNYFEGNRPAAWIGVGHETGHHVYRQVANLRYEIEILVTQALVRNGVSETQQRLWFNYLEETFADLYGILTLGSASVYSLHVIIRNFASPDLDGLLEGSDKGHPMPEVRGTMAVYILQQLLQDSASQDPDLQILEKEWSKITTALSGKPLVDPHTPKSPSLADRWNSTGKLDDIETINVMKIVVDTLLTCKLQALGCKSLMELVKFQEEEIKRHEPTGIPTNRENTELRLWVAAERLKLHQKS